MTEAEENNSDLHFNSDEFDGKIYNDIALKANLEELRLVESSFKINDIHLDELYSGDVSPESKISGKMVELLFNEDDGIASGMFEWTAEIKIGSRKRVLKAVAKYSVSYVGLEKCDEQHVVLYYGKVAKFATYPYFRATFAMLTQAANVFFPPLPALSDRVD